MVYADWVEGALSASRPDGGSSSGLARACARTAARMSAHGFHSGCSLHIWTPTHREAGYPRARGSRKNQEIKVGASDFLFHQHSPFIRNERPAGREPRRHTQRKVRSFLCPDLCPIPFPSKEGEGVDNWTR